MAIVDPDYVERFLDVGDAIEMLHRLADSEVVEQVFIRHAFRYWMGRNEMLSDSRTLIDADRLSLGQLGPRSGASVTDLIRVLGDEDDGVRDAASDALVRMGKKAVPNLVRALQNGNPIFLQAVVDTLGRTGPPASPCRIAA